LDTLPTKLQASSNSPLRVSLDITVALAAGATIAVTPASSYTPPSPALLLCTLRPEDTFGLPIVTSCAHDTDTFTLTAIDNIPTGRYLLEITTLHMDPAVTTNLGVAFPADTNRIKLKVTVTSETSTTISTDAIFIYPTPKPLSKFSIVQRNLLGEYMNMLEIDLTLPDAVPADNPTSEENILIFEFSKAVWDTDLGVSSTFATDGLPYQNGMALPATISIGANAVASLLYGSSTTSPQIHIRGHTGLLAASQTFRISYIKNPPTNKPLMVKIIVAKYDNVNAAPTILNEIEYIAYAITKSSPGDTNPALSVALSNYNSQQITSIILNKNYLTPLDTTSKIYVKLKNKASGLDYDYITNINCGANYNVEWHKSAYIFFLTPTSTLSSNPTITCSGFKNLEYGTIEIETGIWKLDNLYVRSSSSTVIVTDITSPVGETRNVITLANHVSQNRAINYYKLTYNSGTYQIPAGYILQIRVPSGLEPVVGRSEFIQVIGLKDDTNTKISASVSGNNINIKGFAKYDGTTDGDISITVLLRNKAVGTNHQFRIAIYEPTLTFQVAQSALFPAITVTNTGVTASSFTSYKTDAVILTATQQYPLKIQVKIGNAMTSATNSKFTVTLPTGYTISSTLQTCKYSKDNGVNWIRSTACSVTGQDIDIPIVEGFDLAVNDVVLIRLSTEDFDNVEGVVRATDPTLYTFHVTNTISGTVRESVFIPYVLLPAETAITYRWLSSRRNDASIIQVSFTADQNYLATDIFHFNLFTHNELGSVWPVALGQPDPELRMVGACAEDPTNGNIMSPTIKVGCYYVRATSASTTTPAQIVIPNQKAINSGATVKFYVANVQNPSNQYASGWEFSVRRKCRDDGFTCPILYRRFYVAIGATSSKTGFTVARPTLEAGKQDLLETNVLHTFSISYATNMATTDAFVVKVPTQLVKQSIDCTTTSAGMCIHFADIGWTLFMPSSTMTANPKVFTLRMDNAYFYDRTGNLDFNVEIWRSGEIVQIHNSDHPNYNPKVPSLATFPTQTDFDNQYIVRVLDNILRLSATSFWRTSLVKKAIINVPPEFPPITSTYCFVGVDDDDCSSPNYHEFPCRVTGPRQLEFVFTDPWESGDEGKDVRIYYRAWMTINNPTGTTSDSTITSYTDLVLNHVLDENTHYNFYISPTPTPILRDVNLNLKSFAELQAQIGDYVMFYAAIWPYTLQTDHQITQVVFQVSDEYTYPALSSFTCNVKRIFKQNVNCRLQRRLGRTEFVVDLEPPEYDHGPFLVRITQPVENLLFLAPDREGSFLFNLTFLDANGNMVEQADSYMSIDGLYVNSFNFASVIADPLMKTLWMLDFETADRLTPQGFYDPALDLYTNIYVIFQTTDPAFPIDLGSGLPDGSDISCLPVEGITCKYLILFLIF